MTIESGILFDFEALEATATNSEGSTTASINLSWGCEEEVVSEEEAAEDEEQEEAGEEEGEETEEEGGQEEQDNQGQVSEGDLFPPELSISIYEGPLYSAADDVCYYHIEAELYGNPYPTLTWSKDDSNHTLGWDRAQVNLRRGESYTLIATATNSEGTVTRELDLSGGGDGADGDGNDDGEGGDQESKTITLSGDPDYTGWRASALEVIGDVYVGYLSGYGGLNADGFVGFDIAQFKGKDLQLATFKITGLITHEPRDLYKGIDISLGDVEGNQIEYLALYRATDIFTYNETPLLNGIKTLLANNKTEMQINFFYVYKDDAEQYDDNDNHCIQFEPSTVKLEVTYFD